MRKRQGHGWEQRESEEDAKDGRREARRIRRPGGCNNSSIRKEASMRQRGRGREGMCVRRREGRGEGDRLSAWVHGAWSQVTGVCVCVCLRARVSMYVCVRVCVCVCGCLSVCICVRVRAHVRICMYAYACVGVRACVYMQAHHSRPGLSCAAGSTACLLRCGTG